VSAIRKQHRGVRMAQSLSQIYVHIIFSTKNRKPFLQDIPSRQRLHKFLAKTCNTLDSPCLEAGGVEDHVHLLCRLSKSSSVSDLIKELKRSSSVWVKTELAGLDEFYWQSGYGAFSISPSHVEALQRYIINQEKHHRRESFQDEFRRLLRKYNIEFDERYVWD
jgi:REP element-mobilizing transposase RayT